MLNSEIGQTPKLRIRMKVPPAAPKTSADRLAALIESSIASDPHEASGSTWCKRGREGLASDFGVAPDTITRLLKDTRFVSTTRQVDGSNVLLVRVGEKTPQDRNRDVAIKLRNIWRRHLEKHVGPKRAELEAQIEALKALVAATKGKARKEAQAKLNAARKALDCLHILRETAHEFGLLNGLAGALPDGYEEEIFRDVLADYPMFCAGVKLAQVADPEVKPLFQHFPHIATILRFHPVAVEMLVMKQQAAASKSAVWKA